MATKLTMKEAQIVGVNEEQIISKIDNVLKLARDTTIEVKKLCTTPYHPETNGQCEHFNATLICMLGTLPTHAKRNWQELITTLTHAYNCTVSSVTGFSPYFLMFGRTPKIPLDVKWEFH